MPSKTKATQAEPIQAEAIEKAKTIHAATQDLLSFLHLLDAQSKEYYIDLFDKFTAEDYIQFKADLNYLINISDLLLDNLENYEQTYF